MWNTSLCLYCYLLMIAFSFHRNNWTPTFAPPLIYNFLSPIIFAFQPQELIASRCSRGILPLLFIVSVQSPKPTQYTLWSDWVTRWPIHFQDTQKLPCCPRICAMGDQFAYQSPKGSSASLMAAATAQRTNILPGSLALRGSCYTKQNTWVGEMCATL